LSRLPTTRVRIDHAGDVVDQADHLLGHAVGRGCLAREDHRARHPVGLRVRQNLVVACDHVQHVEQLALVLVHALDLHVEQAVRIDLNREFTQDVVGQAALVLLLGQAHGIVERGFVGQLAQPDQLVQVAPPVRADAVVDQLGQGPVGLGQPSPRGDAIGLVAKALGKQAREIREDGLAHQLAVQRRDAVDLVARQDAQVRHAHAARSVLVNQRDAAQQVGLARMALVQAGQETRIEVKDDAQVSRKQPAQQVHRPGLQRLLHQGVVGVAEDAAALRPGAVPVHAVLVDQQPHEFGHGQCGMGVVQVDRHLVGQDVEAAVVSQETSHEILQRGADEEELLAQAQFAPVIGAVVRVQHPGDVLRLVLRLHRAM
jgi:hypothetical protein